NGCNTWGGGECSPSPGIRRHPGRGKWRNNKSPAPPTRPRPPLHRRESPGFLPGSPPVSPVCPSLIPLPECTVMFIPIGKLSFHRLFHRFHCMVWVSAVPVKGEALPTLSSRKEFCPKNRKL